ncbi:hypothetical protein BGX28_000673 [Mortierella sp. GBA30]|nr:hypothetical protein BGX28_000673 [Mortierella sp. GBA30]
MNSSRREKSAKDKRARDVSEALERDASEAAQPDASQAVECSQEEQAENSGEDVSFNEDEGDVEEGTQEEDAEEDEEDAEQGKENDVDMGCRGEDLELGPDSSPSLGDKFSTVKAAKILIGAYARRQGFDISIGRSNYQSRPRTAQLVCRLAGTPKINKKHEEVEKQRPNAKSKKCSCEYRINLNSPQSIYPSWRITKIISKHNHPMRKKEKDVPLGPDMKALIKKGVNIGFDDSHIKLWVRSENRNKTVCEEDVIKYISECREKQGESSASVPPTSSSKKNPPPVDSIQGKNKRFKSREPCSSQENSNPIN